MRAGTVEILPADEVGIARGRQLLAAGEVIGFPTDTVYGLAALASDQRAIRRIYELKGRPLRQPLVGSESGASKRVARHRTRSSCGRPANGRHLVVRQSPQQRHSREQARTSTQRLAWLQTERFRHSKALLARLADALQRRVHA